MSLLKFMLTAAVLIAASKSANALECYVCRGCATVGPEDIQTCPDEEPGTTISPEEPGVTDSDTIYDGRESRAQDVKNIQWLQEAEAKYEDNKDNGYVIDDSPLPGTENFASRSLKQFRVEGDARCVLSLFEENGATNVVRSCSTASDDDNLRCAEAVGNNYTGDVQYCRLCDEDLCNSASKTAMGVAVMTLVVSISYFLV